VVRELSLEIGAGELVSLLGPSGCGKTTTLRMIAGLERADGGSIRLGDAVVEGPGVHVPPEKRGLGMVFQSYAIWPHRTVAENVAYPLALRGIPRADRPARVRKALEQVHLESLGDRRPHQLSGGQLQRVALARALVTDPPVLLLDEPLSNVDAALREELRAEIAALRARIATTMVYVTHDQSEALALSDRVAVMNGGRIEQVDRPEQVYRNPATPFVAGFVGGANVLSGEIDGESFVAEGVRFSLPASVRGAPGKATLVARAEDLAIGQGGPELPLSARLFLGDRFEYRFQLGTRSLRVIGGETPARPGQRVAIQLLRGRLFPPSGM
jgi:ABC-type Fe3+/spermidine/putrescine transport system ATPase subunit